MSAYLSPNQMQPAAKFLAALGAAISALILQAEIAHTALSKNLCANCTEILPQRAVANRPATAGAEKSWPPADDSQVPDSLRWLYLEDAARLALRSILQAGAPASERVELPADLTNTLYSALIHVYNARKNIPPQDVLEIYRTHTFPSPSTREIIVGVGGKPAWADAWSNGQRLTGNRQVDILMETFSLQLQRYLAGSGAAILRSSGPLNTVAVAKQFAGIPGVSYAQPNNPGGDGDDIKAQFKGSYWEIDYIQGFGDCQPVCIQRRIWTFRVYPDGKVEYAGSRLIGTGTPVRDRWAKDGQSATCGGNKRSYLSVWVEKILWGFSGAGQEKIF
ncbi:hypothetical protein [Kamptonema formosum]|uniref:hypothetical protein n=1 Tax=Kamptonema formosum TaxID=331992 RepID=UPI000381F161|nr:hypothetical protein [Oscillatoria sp. PCC 10802]